jgi:hypothetical protein
MGLLHLSGWLGLILVLLVVWSLTWKGMALWRSARRGHKVWFVVFLLVNTLGILEMVYVLAIAPRSGKRQDATVAS